MTNPARPGVTIDASQRVLIEALPPVLVLHVKRFCYDTTVGGVVKVTKQVRFEPELEIGSGMCLRAMAIRESSRLMRLGCVDMMAPTGKRPQSTKYRLFGGMSFSCSLHSRFDILIPICSSLPPRSLSIRRALHSRRSSPEPVPRREAEGGLGED